MRNFATLLVGIALLVLLALPSLAAAQQQAGGPLRADRQGWVGGFGVGVGNITADCDGCGEVLEAGGLDGHPGLMVNARLAGMGGFWVMGHTENQLTITQAIVTAAAQFWITHRLWVKGGVGVAQAAYHWKGALVSLRDETDSVPGMMVGVGYELRSRRDFAIDLQLRYGTGLYSQDATNGYDVVAHNTSLSVGFNWY